MKAKLEVITGKVSRKLQSKVDRFFRNDDPSIWTELLQNARRAGASSVDIKVEEVSGDPDNSVVTVRDNGRGIDKFQNLLSLAESGWNEETRDTEDPAGIGFYVLCMSTVEVWSGDRIATIPPEAFLGKCNVRVRRTREFLRGTQLRFTRASTKDSLLKALARATEFYPIETTVNGSVVERHDFLDGALYREEIDGIEVGFATQFTWREHYYGENYNWNFYGAQLREPFEAIKGLLRPGREAEQLEISAIDARFNVLNTGRIKLQLPERRGIIQGEAFTQFIRQARAAAYRFFQKESRHAMPYRNWEEAKELGVSLPAATPLLSTWRASPQDEFVDNPFGNRKKEIVSDLTPVALVETPLPNQHTVEGALNSGATLEYTLYEEDGDYRGYSWYDRLPSIVDSTIFVDGVPYEDWPDGEGVRPQKIEVEMTIQRTGSEERTLRLPALIHVESDSCTEPEFVVVSNSPWDGNGTAEPFDLIEFLTYATFSHSDDFGECDSWNTQKEGFDRDLRRCVQKYLHGRKASLVAILEDAIGWDADDLAKELGVVEIHFKRPDAGGTGWKIEFVESQPDISDAVRVTTSADHSPLAVNRFNNG